MVKLLAWYLPQYHTIPENDAWWEAGFTEWTNVKNASPLFENHDQPRIPLNDNYYNLLNDEVKQWQINLAKKAGIYGFCVYHYWFGTKMLLEKPMEQYLTNKNLDFPFCFSWANEDWTNAWVADEGSRKVLIHQTYGDELEWKKHFDYLLPFFKDYRYIKENNRPFFVIYKPNLMECCDKMLDYWDSLAKQNGFNGMTFAYQHHSFHVDKNVNKSRFKYGIEYEPNYAMFDMQGTRSKCWDKTKRKIATWMKKKFGMHPALKTFHERHYSYDKIWDTILSREPENDKIIPGAFVDWDNTSRRMKKGTLCDGVSPEKFENYLVKQIIRTESVFHKDMLFIFAWNEWSEGGYLEPDKKHGYAYLDAIHRALERTNNLKHGYEK